EGRAQNRNGTGEGSVVDLDQGEARHVRARVVDVELEVVALLGLPDELAEVLGRADLLPVDLRDDVALLDPRVRRRRAFLDVGDEVAVDVGLYALHLALLDRELRDLDADPHVRGVRLNLARE